MDISLSIILDRLSEYRIETYLLQPSEYIFDRIELFPQRIADPPTRIMLTEEISMFRGLYSPTALMASTPT